MSSGKRNLILKREELLKIARMQLQISGYNDLSLTKIADYFGITRAALCYHFSSKEKLVLEVAKQAEKEFMVFAKRSKVFGATHSLNLFLRTYYKYADSCSSLCLIGVFTFSYHSLPEPIKKIAGQYIAEVFAWLEQNLYRGQSSGEYQFQEFAKAMAGRWISVLPGALQAARYLGDSFFRQTARELKNSLLLKDGDPHSPFLMLNSQKRFINY